MTNDHTFLMEIRVIGSDNAATGIPIEFQDDVEDDVMLHFVFVFGAVFNCNASVLSPYPSVSTYSRLLYASNQRPQIISDTYGV